MRADGLPTQHMRALAYWMAAPELEQMTSMQVCGTEWVSHVSCRRKLMDELMPDGNGGGNGNGDGASTRPTTSSTGWSRARSGRWPRARARC